MPSTSGNSNPFAQAPISFSDPSRKKSETFGNNKPIHVLAIDDDPVTLRALERHLAKRNCQLTLASNGSDGLESITPEISVALIDLCMPGLDGMDCLRFLNKHHPNVSVIILTASDAVNDAVTAMKEGAFQYVTKPFDPNALLVHIEKAHLAWQLAEENNDLREALSLPDLPGPTPLDDTDFGAQLKATVTRVAKSESTVFIGGESGTGKTTVARMIHQHGPRSNEPFVSINCASLPRDLIESELFGHVKGAFTGAIKDRIGKAEIADGGTLFLDEIGDLPLELQPKLLTFLQDRVIQRVGCNVERTLDVRLIVATHRDLAAMCRENRFRQDLYYRLNVLFVHLEPLRHRSEIIPQIAKSTLQSLCKRDNRPIVQLSEPSLAILRSYPWPGNIRELENVLERAVAFTDQNEIHPTDLVFDSPQAIPESSAFQFNPMPEPAAPPLAGRTLEEIEIDAIIQTLDLCNGNKAKTARTLGISEKSIYNKIKRLKIDYPGPSDKQTNPTSEAEDDTSAD